jgi:hypothetical protein
MLSYLLVRLYHGVLDHARAPLWGLKLGGLDLQNLCQLFMRDSVTELQSPSLPSSSILHLIQQHPSYKAVREPQEIVSTNTASGSKLESLPSEIRLMIMNKLGDIDSLRSLSLASKTFNLIRLQHNFIILPAVLENEIDESVFDDAYWALQAAQQDFDQSNFVTKHKSFLAEWVGFDRGTVKPKDVPITGLIELSALHRNVKSLVDDFCSYSLNGPLATSSSCTNPPAITAVEFNRIARAFYHFELYCSLYKDHPLGENWRADVDENNRVSPSSIRRNSYKIFAAWSAWEVEGIACVKDYFCARLTEAFSNIQEAASASPLQVHIYHPWDEPIGEELPENHVNFCDDIVPDWYDETAPSGANFFPHGKSSPPTAEDYMLTILRA